MTICCRSVNFFVMCASLAIAENLAETLILKDIFIFLANGHCFEKCYFLVEILSFLKEVSSVFEMCSFSVALFSFRKNDYLMQKVLVFVQMIEFWNTVIKSCCANFRAKGQIFSITTLMQNCQFWASKMREMLTFVI